MSTAPRTLLALALTAALAGCADDADPASTACDAEPVVRSTAGGVDFVRTPDACFDDLTDWPYAAEYVEIDGLRQAYVDEGPSDGPVVLLLHGQPSWSYLYRSMIPVLTDAGFRVIAMDHLGMGRSDKPVDVADYSYIGHYERTLAFLDALDLQDVHLFVQDWGSLIGLRVVGLNPERFAAVAVGNGNLPVIPAGLQPIPDIADPDALADLTSPFGDIPDQQPTFYGGEDGCEPLGEEEDFSEGFGAWATYAMTAEGFRPSEVLEALTWYPLPEEEEAAYDAPFPSRPYMAGPRVFPSLINGVPGANDAAWAGLTQFRKPFLTVWAANDPGSLGACETQQALIDAVPGAGLFPHTRLEEASHFLQDDQGPAIAERLVDFFRFDPSRLQPQTVPYRYCEILLVHGDLTGAVAEVWGTPTLNDCPADAWEALDPDAIAAEAGALAAIMNGPRIWLAPAQPAGLPSLDTRWFGDLEMRLLATVAVDPSQVDTANAYEASVVTRDTVYTFPAGAEVYELTAPDATYVMQSLSLIVDSDLAIEDLPTLADRLTLPEGWSYAPRVLDAPLVMPSNGAATVTTDDLGNTYQKR
jgi:pimeloyl-ACP methyl ester carboxylesterase